MSDQPFNNQVDTTPDRWAEVNYPLCTKFGLRIQTGPTPSHWPGIPFEALRECLQKAGKWGDWLNWGADGLTAGSNGIYPHDVERFLGGLENLD